MEDFSFERLQGSQSSKVHNLPEEKKKSKDVKSQSEIIFNFLSKKWQNFTFKTICKSFDRLSCEWPFCWEQLDIFTLSIFKYVLMANDLQLGSLFFYSGMRTHSSFFSALSSENYTKKRIKIRTLINRIISNSSDGFTNFLYDYESTKFSRNKNLLIFLCTANVM